MSCELDREHPPKPHTSLVQLLVLIAALRMRHEFSFPLCSRLLWAAGTGRKEKRSACPAKWAAWQKQMFWRGCSDVTQFLPWSHCLMLVAITTCEVFFAITHATQMPTGVSLLWSSPLKCSFKNISPMQYLTGTKHTALQEYYFWRKASSNSSCAVWRKKQVN